jgi:hypothetical protein
MMDFRVPNPGWVDAPWWEVMGAQLRAESMTGQVWIDKLAAAWCIVRSPESLTIRQLGEQTDMIERMMGRRFYTTRPYRYLCDRPLRAWGTYPPGNCGRPAGHNGHCKSRQALARRRARARERRLEQIEQAARKPPE